MKLCGQKYEQPQKIFFVLFPKLTFRLYVPKYETVLLRIFPNLLSCKVLSGNMIYEMKVYLNIDSVFKLNYLKLLF